MPVPFHRGDVQVTIRVADQVTKWGISHMQVTLRLERLQDNGVAGEIDDWFHLEGEAGTFVDTMSYAAWTSSNGAPWVCTSREP